MWTTLIQFATSSVAGLVAMLLAVASLVGGGAYFQHRIDASAMLSLEASYQAAALKATQEAAARQKAMDDNALSASNAETTAQQRMAASTQARLAYLKAHPTGAPCVSFGLIRVLDAAVLGVQPADLNLPAGKSANACSTVTADAMAKALITDFGNARANAEQLDALIALLKKQRIAEKQ